MKKIILIITLLVCLPIAAQFENGYIMKNNGEKLECLIKNKEWLSSPNIIDYKVSEESEVITTNLEEITEFCIYDTDYFYKKFTVSNEKKQDQAGYITSFFKVLVLGQASLYQYDGTTFYYTNKNSNLIRLVHERQNENTLEEDLTFRKQLFVNLNTFEKSIDINKLNYTKKDLIKYIVHYNEIQKSDFKIITLKSKKLKTKFKVNLFGGYGKTDFDIHNSFYRERIKTPSEGGGIAVFSSEGKMKIKNIKSYFIGFETEFILPFHKHKWAVFTSPNYFSQEGVDTQPIPAKDFNNTIKYNKLNSLKIPIGIKHYFHLNKNTKLNIGTFISFNFLLNKDTFEQIESVNSNDTYALTNRYYSLENNSSSQKAFGIISGITLHEKYNFSIQYDYSNNMNTKYTKISFKNFFSFILKYSIW